ncbi:outer membrane protein assembly factor BamB family protein [Sphingobium sp. HWE2-09]|uniref:outer membrane protein assembly factor BamB family protein n=1 Tax=Sphingobium sp. HWE2-09 TaxID=3108390 RepID=UPI002DC4AAD3|nr:PQQ-binding-like beta-propeller repeat protein [Sphingobium sp. HWE2-09]
MRNAILAMAGLLALVGCASGGRDVGAGDDWPYTGGDVGGSHHSRLTDIDKGNAGRLGLAWSYDLNTNRVQEATPVVIDGVMYSSGNLGRVYALDAATGKPLWTFEPEVDMQANRSACCDQANRGVAVANGKVMVGALDGMLYALDAKTGKILWKVDTVVDHSRGYTSTGAPEVAGDLVLIGNAGAEYDTRGYVTAYRIADGGQAWRFYTVPHDPAKGPQEGKALDVALKTWDAKSRWDIGGGGTVWDAINYDPKYGTVYIGVGNGGPYSIATRSPKGGTNLYLSSIVALDAKSGAVKWHYQETPGDSWDFTATQPMVLTDMEVDGKVRPVILHSPKNGYLFVLDRETGKPLRVNALVRTNWAKGFDKNGVPQMTPERTDFWNGPRIIYPASAGARNWYPAAYDAERKSYYAHVLDMGNLMFTVPPGTPAQPRRPKALNVQTTLIFTPQLQAVLPTLPPAIRAQVEKLPEMQWVKDKPYSSELRAIDPLTGKARWAVPTEGWQDRMGVLSTASGLIVHGTIGGKLIVRDADNGTLIKAIDTGSSIMAAPMTYRVKGVQYIAVAAGFGGGGWGYVPRYSAAYRNGNANRILVFKLDGGPVTQPTPLPPMVPASAPPAQKPGVTPAVLAKGQGLFFQNCAICHSNQLRSTAPDLRRMQPATHDVFNQIVRDGLLLPNGMPRWDDLLSVDDVDAIHAWLIAEQGPLRERELKLKAAGKPIDAPSAAIMSNF